MRLPNLVLLTMLANLLSAQPTFTKQDTKYYGDLITPDIGVHRIIPSLKSSISSSTIYVIQASIPQVDLSFKVSKAPEVFNDTSVIALINLPNTGYQKINGRSNGYKPRSSAVYFGWSPIESKAPYVRFFEKDEFNSLSKTYLNVVEDTLLIKLDSVMVEDEEMYMSISAIGIDKYNNLIFVHSRSPYSLNKFAITLLESLKGIKALILTAKGQESVLGFNGRDMPEFSYGSFLAEKLNMTITHFFSNSTISNPTEISFYTLKYMS